MRTLPPISSPSPLKIAANGVRVAIRLTPRARGERIDGITGGAFKVSVTAPPAENQANEALLRLLSREWRLPRRDLSIAAGAKSRNKIVQIAGDPKILAARLGSAIAALPAA
jgi:uncharacterized protein (TIGR00251 family)